jgi:23S rRNA (cytidine1920-2'-O)/16S rRNA (cytidine1409-2'-O)-methyltransferase
VSRIRLDQELVRRRLLLSRSGARLAILQGQVSVAGATVVRPAHRVDADSEIELDPDAGRYVGRGALKLAFALDRFGIEPAGRTAIDVGASTGGFTDVLLDRGAKRVVAVDVGHSQLNERLRRDPRVVVREGVNVRYAAPQDLGAPLGIVVVDLSFISLCLVAEKLERFGDEDADWVLLVKPQFEVGPDALGKGGVVRSANARATALVDVAQCFVDQGLVLRGAAASPIAGGSGNREALLWMKRSGERLQASDLYKVLDDE